MVLTPSRSGEGTRMRLKNRSTSLHSNWRFWKSSTSSRSALTRSIARMKYGMNKFFLLLYGVAGTHQADHRRMEVIDRKKLRVQEVVCSKRFRLYPCPVMRW